MPEQQQHEWFQGVVTGSEVVPEMEETPPSQRVTVAYFAVRRRLPFAWPRPPESHESNQLSSAFPGRSVVWMGAGVLMLHPAGW
jgi:hypothetical protein